MNNVENMLYKLSKSKFRSSFHLKEKDILYIKEKGLETIKDHAKTFIEKRLAPEKLSNDGHQTPMKGHPVFIAEHATATCCRSFFINGIRFLKIKNYQLKTKNILC